MVSLTLTPFPLLSPSLFPPFVSSPSTAAHRRNMATSYIEKQPQRVPVSVLDLTICVGQILLGGCTDVV